MLQKVRATMNRHDFVISSLKNAALVIVVIIFFLSDSVDAKLNQIMTFLFLAEFWNALSK